MRGWSRRTRGKPKKCRNPLIYKGFWRSENLFLHSFASKFNLSYPYLVLSVTDTSVKPRVISMLPAILKNELHIASLWLTIQFIDCVLSTNRVGDGSVERSSYPPPCFKFPSAWEFAFYSVGRRYDFVTVWLRTPFPDAYCNGSRRGCRQC